MHAAASGSLAAFLVSGTFLRPSLHSLLRLTARFL